jgi:hypothetical protein
MPVTEVSKAAGAEWKTVSKWDELAALDKVSFI